MVIINFVFLLFAFRVRERTLFGELKFPLALDVLYRDRDLAFTIFHHLDDKLFRHLRLVRDV